ncbi:hypothetical protein [Ochrobactrum chromiisoli]|uniref:DNA transfer protein n=1 Tax=Ochrobactrum chromiisoli TaxID=2993941 RepID=A0ABT3QUH5_9HYPH|nr:hypothetical protein [Ochrobactrum chromiisoli]MCX2699283.1 hypothetical protein [Ochrobactrum chromiisoli]
MFDYRFNGLPNMLTARMPLMPQNMLSPMAQQPPQQQIDPTATAAIPQPMPPVPAQVPQGDLNYFPPQPDANAPPITPQDYQASLSLLQPQQSGQAQTKPQSVGGGLDMGTVSAFLQGLGRGNGLLSAIGGGLGAVQERKQENQTVKYLTSRGIPEGEAQLLAQSPQATFQVLQNMRNGGDPKAMLELQKLGLEVENLRNPQIKPTTLMQNLSAAGLQPGTPEYQQAVLAGTKSGVNVDARNMGSIPQGYRVNYDENGNPVSMSPIPGGPEDTTKTDAAWKQNLATSTDIIINAAKSARELAKSGGRMTTGVGGQVLSNIGESNAAELRRQVATLTANAKIENLQAMRAASTTGGALGAVSDSENAMLAAKTGALDPSASPEVFQRQLDDYERTLLRIVHGKEAGDSIFEETRGESGGAVQAGQVEDGYRFKGGDPANPQNWEKVN